MLSYLEALDTMTFVYWFCKYCGQPSATPALLISLNMNIHAVAEAALATAEWDHESVDFILQG